MAAPTISGIRAAIATNLNTITGLRAFGFEKDAVPVPGATVGLTSIEYDKDFGGGFNAEIKVRVLVSKATDKNAQEKLDGYLAASGALSVKAAIESDRTLGGAAGSRGTLAVTGIDAYGVYQYGEVDYLGAEFTVTVYAFGT